MSKVVLVTGGNTGIGAAIVKAFAEKGYFVIIHYYELEEEAKKLASSLKEKCVIVKGNIVQKSTLNALLGAVKKIGRLDVLVNNAGINIQKDLFATKEKDWIDTFKVNIIAPFSLIQMLASELKKSRGSVINIGSIRGCSPRAGNIAYGASKAALASLTKAAAKSLGPGVRVNCVSPGPTLTRMQEKKPEKGAETLLGRCGKPEEVAQIVVAIAENTFMTGSDVIIDGGALL